MTREAKTVAVVGVKSWFIHLNESLETKRNKKKSFPRPNIDIGMFGIDYNQISRRPTMRIKKISPNASW